MPDLKADTSRRAQAVVKKNKSSLLKKASIQKVRTLSEFKRDRFNSRPGMVSYLDEKEANMGRQRIVEDLMSKWNA